MTSFITKSILLILFIAISPFQLVAQGSALSGWFFLSHTQKLTGKWSYMTDVQFRSSSAFTYLQNTLIRPGLLYELTDQQSVGVGYTYFATRNQTEKVNTFEPENRIFEQYVHKFKIKRFILNNRLRLEQRFIQKTTGDIFAQRLRHQIQAHFFLITVGNLNRNLYLNLQNEIFMNVQNQHKINNNFFDQNRPYAALGYAISEKLQLEVGYYYRFQVEEKMRNKEGIFQLLITTDF
jgi:hypothetical protein